MSEHGEQIFIHRLLRHIPTPYKIFVDIGALTAHISNTFFLLKQGWKGFMVEPNPTHAATLKQQTQDYNAQVICAAISDNNGKQPLYLHSVPGHDSLDPEWYPPTKTNDTILVDTMTPDTLLRSFKIPTFFELLSIDTEGYDKIILTSLLTKTPYRPSIIITEGDSFNNDLTLFKQHGYKLKFTVGNPSHPNFIFSRL